MTGRIHVIPSTRTPPPVPPRTAQRAADAASALRTIDNDASRQRCTPAATAAPPAASVADDDGWGSDFDDVCYTPQEQAWFDVRFELEERQIAAAHNRWLAEMAKPHSRQIAPLCISNTSTSPVNASPGIRMRLDSLRDSLSH